MSTNLGDAVATDRPDALALIDVGAPGETAQHWTYAELEHAIRARAAQLSERLAPGERVGLFGVNSAAWLVAELAIQRAGGVVVPISHKLPADGVAYVVQDASLQVVLADRDLAERRAGALAGADVIDLAAPVPDADFQTVATDPAADAMVLYTSGSTGRPKGVQLSHRSHLWVIEMLAAPVPPDSKRVLISAPLYHMNALSTAQRTFFAGGTLVVLPVFEPAAFWHAVTEHRVSEVSGVPPMFAIAAAHPLAGQVDSSSVKALYMGSAPAAPELFTRLRELFDGVAISFGYGTTESGPVVFGPHRDGLPVPDGSVGAAHPAVELRLVDADGTVRADRGVLEVRVPALLTGYLGLSEDQLPVTADGFHHTKDVFTVDADGFYTFDGREDDMFVSGGENVYPRAVERVLEQHPSVAEAVVVAVPDEVKGTKPVAFVTLVRADVDEDGLRRHVLAHLEPYAHPRRVWILTQLPLGTTNKPDRDALAARAATELGLR
ncbi:class I adenylate-forming enzyme family protein [Ruania zhangjianzhongii]|uniref:class I adenylate-forming enzyme family protein n=1 Tax=Ruania zhangjianzhongii TaxID=2603206 RepID=UPI00143D31D5|nr:class I adenylate-forming enzyme family protein [Ruania zhangjianzhongii]